MAECICRTLAGLKRSLLLAKGIPVAKPFSGARDEGGGNCPDRPLLFRLNDRLPCGFSYQEQRIDVGDNANLVSGYLIHTPAGVLGSSGRKPLVCLEVAS